MRLKYAITTLAVAVGGSLGAFSITSAEPASARATPLIAPAPDVGFGSEPTEGGGRPTESRAASFGSAYQEPMLHF